MPKMPALLRKNSKGKYQQLSTPLREYRDTGFVDAQFEAPPPKVPYKSIALAVLLFVIGTVLLVVGSLIFTGHIGDKRYADRWTPMLVLGSLAFIPGSYHVYIAYYAWRQAPGYSFNDIPDFNE